MELVDERLLLRVGAKEVRVEARFAFRLRDEPTDRVLTFPIPPACELPTGFAATLEGVGERPTALHAESSDEPSSVPMGPIAQRYDVHVPAAPLARHDGVLVVRYAQRCSDEFRYTLLSGAYWHGPIRRLSVMVLDPTERVLSGTVEKRAPHRRRAGSWSWAFRDLEPRGGVALELRLDQAGAVGRPTGDAQWADRQVRRFPG